MWDKQRIRERERLLAALFLSILAVVFGYSLLVLGSPLAGQAVGVFFLGMVWLLTMRRLVAVRQNRYGPAPVGPLSPDERAKARSKLLKTGRPTPLYR